MADWADKKARQVAEQVYGIRLGNTPNELRVIGIIADALRECADESEADARTRENEKCRELIGARVGATQ